MLGRVVKSGLTVAAPVRQSVRFNGLYPTYHKHLVGAPRESIPFAEKAFWGLVFCVGILSTPAWVLYHLEEYKGKKRA